MSHKKSLDLFEEMDNTQQQALMQQLLQEQNERIERASKMSPKQKYEKLFCIMVLRSAILTANNVEEVNEKLPIFFGLILELKSPVFAFTNPFERFGNLPLQNPGVNALKQWIRDTEAIVEKQLASYEREIEYEQYLTNKRVSYGSLLVAVVALFVSIFYGK